MSLSFEFEQYSIALLAANLAVSLGGLAHYILRKKWKKYSEGIVEKTPEEAMIERI